MFVSRVRNFGNFEDFADQAQSEMLHAGSGVDLIVVGQIIAAIGARGLAGWGVLLAPRPARSAMHPRHGMICFSHQQGQ